MSKTTDFKIKKPTMIFCTSIAPKHVNEGIQLKAVKSWIDAGYDVYSFNHKSEIESLKLIYPEVNFIETTRTQKEIFGKHYVCINAIFDYAILNNQDICLINSDIELRTDKETMKRIEAKMNHGLIMANRVNYDNDYSGSQYTHGIDAFFIKKEFLELYPQTSFCLGQCHFDYLIPYWAIGKGVETFFIKQDIIYHKNHHAQYDQDNWVRTGHHFMWVTNMYQFANHIGKMSTFVYNYIYNASQRITI